MERNEIIRKRIAALRDAIAYSRCEHRIMSLGEGILCNQEVAAWYSVLSELEERPSYVVSDEIQEKVKEINVIIEKNKWQRPVELYVL